MLLRPVATGREEPAAELSRALAGSVLLLALLILVVGWGFHWDGVLGSSSMHVAMAPSTGGCLVLLSGALLLEAKVRSSRWHRVAAGIAALVAAGNIVAQGAGIAGGIDALLLPASVQTDPMAPTTAVATLLGAVCLYCLRSTSPAARRTFEICGSVGLLIAAVAVVGYLFGSASLYTVMRAMALPTALLFLALFGAILLVRPDWSWIKTLTGEELGSVGARRLLPVVVVGPVAFCFLALLLTEAGAFDANFRLALLAILLTCVAGAAVIRNAALENETERRTQAIMRDLERANADKELLLREVYHRVKNNLQQIGALMRIEARNSQDPAFRESYRRMGDRVYTLGLVHQLLIAAPAPSEVDMPEFFRRLIEGISLGHDLPARGIVLTARADPSPMQLDRAVALGLLVNELVANAVKHAFVKTGTGRIEVVCTLGHEGLLLAVSDSGVGCPPDALSESRGGGLIIRNLVGQLRGGFEIRNDGGCVVVVRVPAGPREGGLDD